MCLPSMVLEKKCLPYVENGKKNLNFETSKLASMFAIRSHMSLLRLKKNRCSEKAWLQAIENAGQHTHSRKCY